MAKRGASGKSKKKKKKAKPGPSPCALKGQAFGSRRGGAVYRIQEASWRPRGCECQERWRDIGITDRPSAERRISAAIDFATAALTLIEEKHVGQSQKAEGLHTVLPCNETFRFPHSKGTKIYRSAKARNTNFSGCQNLEDELKERNSVAHTQSEVLGTIQDYQLAYERLDQDRDDELSQQQMSREKNWDPMRSKTFDLMPERSTYMREHVQSSWPYGGISERRAARKALVATPLPQWVQILKKNLKDFELTYKQKSAVTRLYFENRRKEPIGVVAKTLRITVDSLKDRIAQVKKKVLARFPEAADQEALQVASGGKKAKREKFESDLSFNGFFRKSSAKTPHPVYRVDPADPSKKIEIKEHPKAKLKKKKDLPKKERDALDTFRNHEELTSYMPAHNGIFSPWVPLGSRTKNNKSTCLIDPDDFRRKLSRLRDWE